MQNEDQKENNLLKVNWSKIVCLLEFKDEDLTIVHRNTESQGFLPCEKC